MVLQAVIFILKTWTMLHGQSKEIIDHELISDHEKQENTLFNEAKFLKTYHVKYFKDQQDL